MAEDCHYHKVQRPSSGPVPTGFESHNGSSKIMPYLT